MFPVTDRFLANLPVARWVPKVEWSRDGVTWLPATLAAGNVTADANSQVRWGTDLTLADVEVGRFALSPYGARLRVALGLAHTLTDVEWVQLGLYRVDDVDRTLTGRGNVQVTGSSLEAQVIDDRFLTPQVFEPQGARQLLASLITESVPGASVQWLTSEAIRIPQIVEERDRWKVIDGGRDDPSVARALGARVFTDGRGVFVVAPVSTLGDEPAWTADTGDGGLLVEATEQLTRDGVYNVIVATGASDDGTPPVGPGIARDDDPLSPTYVAGPFGRVPRFYSSPLLTAQAQCETAALGMLQPYLGLRQQVGLQVPNPALVPGDVISSRMPDGSLQRHIVDSMSIDLLDPSAMSLNARASATNLSGSIYTPPPQEGGE